MGELGDEANEDPGCDIERANYEIFGQRCQITEIFWCRFVERKPSAESAAGKRQNMLIMLIAMRLR